jgi:hypothetical protein
MISTEDSLTDARTAVKGIGCLGVISSAIRRCERLFIFRNEAQPGRVSVQEGPKVMHH